MLQIDLLKDLSLRYRTEQGITQVFDPVRKKWLVLTPEEHVRQAWVSYLTGQMQYPAALIALEKQIRVGDKLKRFDIVVYSRDHQPWLLAELKAPQMPVQQQTLYQLLQYQQVLQTRYWLISNGINSFCADAADINRVSWLLQLPGYPL
jgi:hypothetical protein